MQYRNLPSSLAMACVNNVPPLQLPISSYPTSPNGGLTQGIAVSIGDSHQLFSLRPTTSDNNTWVYNVQSCANASDYSCIARLGGLYDPSKSQSSVPDNSLSSWNGTADSEFASLGHILFYNDEFLAGGNGVIYGYPFYSYTYPQSFANSGCPFSQLCASL